MTGPAAHGSLADEVVRLLEAAQGWLGKASAGTPSGDDTWARATAESTAGGQPPECEVCPLCRSMRFLRSVRPESVEPLVGAASAFAAALQELRRQVDSARATQSPPPPEADTWD